MPPRLCPSHGAGGMSQPVGKPTTSLCVLILVAAGFLGALAVHVPSASAGGPPEDPGSQGEENGQGDEKRPDHAGGGDQGDRGDDEDHGSSDQGGSEEGDQGPPDHAGGGQGSDQDAGDGDQDEEDRSDPGDQGRSDRGQGSDEEDTTSSEEEPGDPESSTDDPEEEPTPQEPPQEEEPTPEEPTEDDPDEEDAPAPSDDEAPTRQTDPGPVDTRDRSLLPEENGLVPVLNPAVQPLEPHVGEQVHLDAGAWDPDGRIVAVDWFLPDGSWLVGPTPTYTFQATGQHTLEVIATDDDGYLATATLHVHVLPAEPVGPAPAPGTDGAWSPGEDAHQDLRQSSLGPSWMPSEQPEESQVGEEAIDRAQAVGTMALVAGLLTAAAALVFRAE